MKNKLNSEKHKILNLDEIIQKEINFTKPKNYSKFLWAFSSKENFKELNNKIFGRNKIFRTNIDISSFGYNKIGEINGFNYKKTTPYIFFSEELNKKISYEEFEKTFSSDIYIIEKNKKYFIYVGNKNQIISEKINLIGNFKNAPYGLFKEDFYSYNELINNGRIIHKEPRIRNFKFKALEEKVLENLYLKELNKIKNENYEILNIEKHKKHSSIHIIVKNYKNTNLKLFCNPWLYIIGDKFFSDKIIKTYKDKTHDFEIGILEKFPILDKYKQKYKYLSLRFDGELYNKIKHKKISGFIDTYIHAGLTKSDEWEFVIGDKIIILNYFKDGIENIGKINNLPIDIFYNENYNISLYFKTKKEKRSLPKLFFK